MASPVVKAVGGAVRRAPYAALPAQCAEPSTVCLLPMSVRPIFVAPAHFDDPAKALAQVQHIYRGSIEHLREWLQRFVGGQPLPQRVRACYPFVRVHTATVARADSRLSYGFVSGPGTYETTLTRPELFGRYYLEQFGLLLRNHAVQLEIGTSTMDHNTACTRVTSSPRTTGTHWIPARAKSAWRNRVIARKCGICQTNRIANRARPPALMSPVTAAQPMTGA